MFVEQKGCRINKLKWLTICSLLSVGAFSAACEESSPRASELQPEVVFKDLADDALPPRDFLDKLRTFADGHGIVSFQVIKSQADVKALHLRAVTQPAHAYRQKLVERIGTILDTTAVTVFFKDAAFVDPEFASGLEDKHGNSLVSILASGNDDRRCGATTVVDKDAVAKGASLDELGLGVCGPIAIVQSFLKLGVLKKEDAIEGKVLKTGPLSKAAEFAKKFPKKGMTDDEVRQAHVASGLTVCQQSSTPAFQKPKLARFNQCLAKRIQELDADRKPAFDCVLGITGSQRIGNPPFGHLEQVKSVMFDPATSSAVIETVNGLTQGDHVTTVPADAGTNKWSSVPGTSPPFVVLGGADRKIAEQLGQVAVETVSFVCCRKRKQDETDEQATASLRSCDL